MNKKLEKKQAVAKFIPHDPYEYGPVMLYAYRDSRPPFRIGIRAHMQVGTNSQHNGQTLTQYHIPKNMQAVDMTPANATMVAHAIMKNTAGALTEAANPAQQAAIAIAKKKDKGVDENFADGKGPGRAGDSARHGIPKHATKAELEKASHAKGRKGQLARWQLNMRNGKNK